MRLLVVVVVVVVVINVVVDFVVVAVAAVYYYVRYLCITAVGRSRTEYGWLSTLSAVLLG